MDLARDPQEPDRGERRYRQHDQLHRQLETEELAERDDQQIDAEVADRRPVIIVILPQPGRIVEVELDPVAAHVAEQIDEWRDRRVEQRNHGRKDDQHDERA